MPVYDLSFFLRPYQVGVPTAEERREILEKLLEAVPHDLRKEEIDEVMVLMADCGTARQRLQARVRRYDSLSTRSNVLWCMGPPRAEGSYVSTFREAGIHEEGNRYAYHCVSEPGTDVYSFYNVCTHVSICT